MGMNGLGNPPSFLKSRKGIRVAVILRPQKRVNVPGEIAQKMHPEGWQSANCTQKRHGTCFSLACACTCHQKGLR